MKLSKHMVAMLVEIRAHQSRTGRQGTYEALLSRGLVHTDRNEHGFPRVGITRAALPYLPKGIPHTLRPVTSLWLMTVDVPGGFIHRILAVTDGKPSYTGNHYYRKRVVDACGEEAWCHRHVGIQAKSAWEAMAIAQKAFHNTIGGFVE